MGSLLFANQYLNEVIPEDEKSFKKHWLRYYSNIPERHYNFGFIDPAIGQQEIHDYTGIVVVSVDVYGDWYLRYASRERLTPTQIVKKMFDLHKQFNLRVLGVETVAYQEALLYFLDEEMRSRRTVIPVKGIGQRDKSKKSRILALVPRFEWGRLTVAQGLREFEDEYHGFPRGKHDDILDALASIEEIVYYPHKEEEKLEKPHSPHDKNYERWVARSMAQRNNESEY